MKKYVCLCAAALLYVSCSNMSAPKYPNMVANIDPFSLGSINASLNQILSSKLKETAVEVIFYPRENEVVLEFQDGLTYHRQFWNEPGRELFIKAVSRYKEDFANQKLLTTFNKSRAAYGKVKGRVEWKPLKFSATYRASPFIEVGYRFVDNTPYFSTHQLKAKEESDANGRGNITESQQFVMYFSRAQCEELARLFDQAFLLESLPDTIPKEASGTSDRDDYYRQPPESL